MVLSTGFRVLEYEIKKKTFLCRIFVIGLSERIFHTVRILH